MSALDDELAGMGLDAYDREKFKKALKEARDKQKQSGGSAFDHFCNIIRRTASWIWDKLSRFWDWLKEVLDW